MKAGFQMKIAPYDYILKIVQDTNILPITSSCTTSCIFCSHKNNPEGTDVYSLPSLSFEMIKEMVQFLRGDRKIVIGESASRIIEGEPFFRKDIVDILKYIRSAFPYTPIEITTSGVFFTEEAAEEIKRLEPVEINISLNSSNCIGRKLLFRGRELIEGVGAVEHLEKNNIRFNGSIVALPDLVGYEDIEETAAYLCKHGAETVRVFVPGFSRLSEFKIDAFSIRRNLQKISDSIYDMWHVPVLVEPPEIDNLNAEICGIIKSSAADSGGLLKGDIILKIDGYIPLTRVDAYQKLYDSKNPSLTVIRKGQIININIEKSANLSSGAVFYYDMDPETIYSIENSAIKYRAQSPAAVTSRLALNTLSMAMKKLVKNPVDIVCAESRYFGGSIMCCGLLTVTDMVEALQDAVKNRRVDLIILPPAPFDANGKDLSGKYYSEIEETLGIKTVIAE